MEELYVIRSGAKESWVLFARALSRMESLTCSTGMVAGKGCEHSTNILRRVQCDVIPPPLALALKNQKYSA